MKTKLCLEGRKGFHVWVWRERSGFHVWRGMKRERELCFHLKYRENCVFELPY